MKKFKKDDNVIAIAGKDKGRQGKVIRVVEDRVFVSGLNMVKKHVKPNPSANKPGGIIEKEASIHVSNVGLFNPKKGDAGSADRIGYKIEDGKKVRFYKSTNTLVGS